MAMITSTLLFHTLMALNMFLCIIIIAGNLFYYFNIPDDIEKWTKLFYTGIGLAWFVRYALYFMDNPPLNLNTYNPSILILTSFTLLGFALASIIRVLKVMTWKEIVDILFGGCKWMSK